MFQLPRTAFFRFPAIQIRVASIKQKAKTRMSQLKKRLKHFPRNMLQKASILSHAPSRQFHPHPWFELFPLNQMSEYSAKQHARRNMLSIKWAQIFQQQASVFASKALIAFIPWMLISNAFPTDVAKIIL